MANPPPRCLNGAGTGARVGWGTNRCCCIPSSRGRRPAGFLAHWILSEVPAFGASSYVTAEPQRSGPLDDCAHPYTGTPPINRTPRPAAETETFFFITWYPNIFSYAGIPEILLWGFSFTLGAQDYFCYAQTEWEFSIGHSK